jgi:DNA topoisomerase-1
LFEKFTFIRYGNEPNYLTERERFMKKLLIVESPAKIKTIKKFLGPDFVIMSTMGHVKDLPSKKMGVERDPIKLEYVALDGKEKTIAELCKAARNADEVYLAPDPDREGEIIAWHVAEEMLKVMKKKNAIHRIAFNEITKPAIIDAISNPHTINMERVAAQQARRVLDRWVGYEVSPILWKKLAKGLSAGRVQSVALKLICDRELAIRDFKPEEHWSITGHFQNQAGPIIAALSAVNGKKPKIDNKATADKHVADIKQEQFAVDSITDKKRLKKPLPPFMTSTLQQAAFNRLGFSVEKTMKVAQNLYEGVALGDGSPTALITYMRTDSLRISDTALKQAHTYVSQNFGKEYVPKSANVYAKKSKAAANTQDAHEAVRPIDTTLQPASIKQYLSPDQAKLYDLIWKRFVACQMTPAQYAQRQVLIKGGKYTFKANGSTLIFDGFLKVYDLKEQDKDNVEIPKDIKAQDAIDLKKLEPKQHFTQPPPRFSEASLVKELEKEGVGRPSTYASILRTIRARSYTTLEKKRFMPTELGMAVTKMLGDNLPHIINVKFTAKMEEDLDKIESGNLERDALLNDFWQQFEVDLKEFKGDETTGRQTQPTDLDCPECKEQKLVIRFGKAGEFLGCPGFPECSFTSNFIRKEEDGSIELVEREQPQELDMNCPKCTKPMREMMGRFGKFISCSGYPECKYIHQDKAGFKCPKDQGDVVKRKWRGGTFWGCGNYPKCKFALFGEIEETPCPQCKLPALIKKIDTKTEKTTLLCSDKKCGYTQ